MPIYNLVYGIKESGGGGWQPGANTLFYYPFVSNQLDGVGNTSIVQAGTKNLSDMGFYFNISGAGSMNNAPNTCRFVSFWIKWLRGNGSIIQSPSTYIGKMLYNFAHSRNDYSQRFECEYSGGAITSSSVSTSPYTWYYMAIGHDGTNAYAYLNGAKVWEATILAGDFNIRFGNNILMFISEYIGESVCWTAEEVLNYYNSTKNNYDNDSGIYVIPDIPTSDTNVYVNVAKSGKTIDSVKFSFTAKYISAQGFFQISGNNNNSNRYGLVFGRNTSGTAPAMAIRGRLGGSDTYYRSITDGFDSSGNNVIEYTINRSGSCSVKCNGTTSTYTATGTELTVLQTIMNLSDMNVYCAQNGGSAGSVIVGNTVDIEVTYS